MTTTTKPGALDVIARMLRLARHPKFHEQPDLAAWDDAVLESENAVLLLRTLLAERDALAVQAEALAAALEPFVASMTRRDEAIYDACVVAAVASDARKLVRAYHTARGSK